MSEFETPGPGEGDAEFHLWLAEGHLRSAQNLLGPALAGGAVAVEFTKDEAGAILAEIAVRDPDDTVLRDAYRKLYKALAIESGGGQYLDPALAPEKAA